MFYRRGAILSEKRTHVISNGCRNAGGNAIGWRPQSSYHHPSNQPARHHMDRVRRFTCPKQPAPTIRISATSRWRQCRVPGPLTDAYPADSFVEELDSLIET